MLRSRMVSGAVTDFHRPSSIPKFKRQFLLPKKCEKVSHFINVVFSFDLQRGVVDVRWRQKC
jgi:hypothetical protein